MVSRRQCALMLGSGALALMTAGRTPRAAQSERWIELKSVHTGESLQAAFDRHSGPDAATLAKLQYLLRDYRVDEQRAMDTQLYGLLCDLADVAGHQARFEVISGYRSPRTNAQLRADGHQVADHSLHLKGQAIDVRLLGCDLQVLRDVAQSAGRGGVGYYPTSNFVHVDTGRIRTWTGR